MKPVEWIGSSKGDLSKLPQDVKDVFGYALFQAQDGQKHSQAEPMKGFDGASVIEVREYHKGDTYRLVYTTKAAAIYMLHAFKKKSKSGIETPQKDVNLIKWRLKKVTEIEDARKKAAKRVR